MQTPALSRESSQGGFFDRALIAAPGKSWLDSFQKQPTCFWWLSKPEERDNSARILRPMLSVASQPFE